MAKAIVTYKQGLNRQNENEFELIIGVTYFGSDVPEDGAIQGPHEVYTGPISNTASVVQIENKINEVVTAHALTLPTPLVMDSNETLLMGGLKRI